MTSQTEFVDGWNIIETLGEGAYGEVKLLVHEESGNAVAVKMVDLKKHRDAEECVTKEERIHRLLIHPHIIRLFGKRQDTDKVYIFLEYAAGGELFNRIEPDVGMSSGEAQKYMKQLLSGVQYLHSKGIAHRDLKPENILLDEKLNIKVSDFGMATVFRLRGKERKLDKRCGTLPYVAPEVLQEPYHAEPADIWSCGIILVAMLAGELPWNEPTDECPEYVTWIKNSGLLTTPWSKLETLALGLAKKMLSPNPKHRPKIEQILQHPWMKIEFHWIKSDDSSEESIEPPTKKHNSTFEDTLSPVNLCVALSQPTPTFSSIIPNALVPLLQSCPPSKSVGFSQPTNNEDLILGSQIQFTQGRITNTNFQRLIKRMTRFFVTTEYEETVGRLCSAFDKLHYSWHISASGMVTVSTTDSRKMKLVFKVNLINMNNKLLLDFRLSKGCGLEFKKRFVKVQLLLNDIISR